MNQKWIQNGSNTKRLEITQIYLSNLYYWTLSVEISTREREILRQRSMRRKRVGLKKIGGGPLANEAFDHETLDPIWRLAAHNSRHIFNALFDASNRLLFETIKIPHLSHNNLCQKTFSSRLKNDRFFSRQREF